LPVPDRYWAMTAILLGIAISVMDSSIVNLALPDITRSLGTSASASVWVVTAYQLATLSLLLPFASLSERLGYRRVYLCGLAVFTVASVCCMAADSLAMLAVARAAQGVGGAGMMGVNSALVRLTYPSSLLGRGLALNSVVVGTGTVAGPTVAALVLSVTSWHWLFAINVPLGIVLLWLGWRWLPHSTKQAAGPLRVSDTVLNILMFSLVFLGADAIGARARLDRAGEAGSLGLGLGLLAAGIAVGIFFVRRQLREPRPLFPVDLLRIRVFSLSMCTSVATFSAQALAFVALPFLLLENQGLSHVQAGLVITAWPLAIVCVAPFVGRLMERHAAGLLGAIGLGLMALGLAAMAALPDHASALDMAWRLVLCGAGFAMNQTPNNHTIVTSAPPSRSGAASGMLGTARLTGQSVGAVMVGIVFSFTGVSDGRGPVIALSLAAMLAALAAVFSGLRLRDGR